MQLIMFEISKKDHGFHGFGHGFRGVDLSRFKSVESAIFVGYEDRYGFGR